VLLEKLRQLQRTHDKKYLTLDVIKKQKRLSYYLYLYYDTVAEALEDAGLESSPLAKSYAKSDKECLNFLWELSFKKGGRKPTTMDLKRARGIDYKTYNRRFGSLGEAYEKAKELFGGQQEKQPELEKKKLVKEQEILDAEIPFEIEDFEYKGNFYGVAAENLVISELLYRGYEAYLINVDLGLDVMAQKDGKFYYLQVKNISFDNANRRVCPVTTSSYLRNKGNNVYYFFVMQKKLKRDYIIIPWLKLQEYESKGYINTKSEKNKLELFFVKDKDKYFITHKDEKESLDSYTNDRAWVYLI